MTSELWQMGATDLAKAIARKNDLLSRIHDYRYDAYVKFILRDLNKNEDSTESIVLITEGHSVDVVIHFDQR